MLEKADAASPSLGSVLFCTHEARLPWPLHHWPRTYHFRPETVLSVRGLISFQVRKQKLRNSPQFKRLQETPCSYHPKLLQKARLWTSCQHIPVELWRWSPNKKLPLRFKQNWTRPGNWCPGNWLLTYLGASHTGPLPTWRAARCSVYFKQLPHKEYCLDYTRTTLYL